MPEPIFFASTSPRFGLPLLFAGQAQREVFVNEALARIDGLLHCAVEGMADAPPASPIDGQTWLIGSAPSGDWVGHADALACRQSGQWLIIPPREGMRIVDLGTGTELRYKAGWQSASPIAPPGGGAVVDVQARATLTSLIAALESIGILPSD